MDTTRVVIPRWALLAVAVIALIPRLYVALTTTYLYDEERDWIPLANSISFESGAWNTPVRGDYHPALPAYGVALGRSILGRNELGSRAVGIILGVATVVLAFVLVVRGGGTMVGAWVGALLLAFNEYHVHASLLATEKAYYLFLATLAVWCFLRFLKEERAKWLFAAAAAAGLSFLSKETGALLGPVFLITLLATQRRAWLARWQPYAAALLFFAVIAPDIWWNLSNEQAAGSADYRRHLSGAGSLGITYQPLLLYGREVVAWVLAKAGRPFYDNAEEYAAGNVVLSLLIAAGVLSAIWKLRKPRDPRIVLFLALFGFVFLFFTVVGTRNTPGLDAFGFFWGDLSLIGGVVLAGLWAGTQRGTMRYVALGVLLAGGVFAATRIFRDKLKGEAVTVRPDPNVIAHAPGVFRDIALTFNYCMLCDQNPRVDLVGVRTRAYGKDLEPEATARLVRHATLGADVRSIQVESSAVEPPSLKDYVLEYRFQDRSGRSRLARGRIAVRMERPDWWAPWEW